MTNNIISEVTRLTGVTFDQMRSSSRKRSHVTARHGAFYLLVKHTNYTLVDIGKFFGGRDHSTVIHGVKKVEDWPPHDKSFDWLDKVRVAEIPKTKSTKSLPHSSRVKLERNAGKRSKSIIEDYNLLEICG